MGIGLGSRIGPYEVTALIGEGGMGKVWQAHHTALERADALKVLPDAFASDPERLARFRREAQVLASLNHPNIAHVYGLEQSDGVQALVMELVEGPTLADLLDGSGLRTQGSGGPSLHKPSAVSRKPAGLPLDEALPIAKQIADALEAAHGQGIIHRDLKPANIKVRPDGTVKVLDFGLAKALEPVSAGVDATASPTITSPAMMTGIGVLLGTAAYMSPEQARGRAVDKRTDIWAFGCVLYEMLTGRRAFEGDDVTDTIAAVVRGEPNWSAIPPETPTSVVDIVRRCLAKDLSRRFGDISVPLFLLSEDGPASPAAATVELHDRPPLWKRAAPVAAAVLLTAAVAASAAWMLRPTPPSPAVVTRFTMPLPQGQQFTGGARRYVDVSRDGSQLVYGANDRLYMRRMGDLEPRLIPGSDLGGSIVDPVLSPDGREVAFWNDGAIRRLATAGGAAVVVCSSTFTSGMRWDEDWLVFGRAGGKEIARVPAGGGGTPEVIVKVGGDEDVWSPQLLPDGHGVLFSVKKTTDSLDKARVVVQVADGSRKVLVNEGADGRYLASGHLVYAVAGVLMAVPFDLERLEVTGGAAPVVEGVRRTFPRANLPVATVQLSVSTTGSLVFVPGPARPGESSDRRLAVFDGKGGVEPLNMPLGLYEAPRVSRDGKTVAFQDGEDTAVNVWVLDLDGKSAPRRLTNNGQNRAPIWSVDGQWIAFQSDREGDLAIYRQRADGSASAERLTKPEKGIVHIPQSWSPDGAHLLFTVGKDREFTLQTISLADQKTREIPDVRSQSPTEASFSPDGGWIVYQSRDPAPNTSTQSFVQPFPPTGAKYLVPQPGGHPYWSTKGDRLILNNGPDGSMAVGIVTSPRVSFSPPVPISRIGRLEPRPAASNRRGADALPDGRILGIAPNTQVSAPGAAPADQIVVVLNWQEELKRLVPTR